MQCRQEHRQSINTKCRIRTGPGLARRAVVSDLSSEGCAVHSPRLALRRSDKVEVQIGDERSIVAEVRWSLLGEAVGLKFRNPLNAAEVDTIAREALRASIEGVSPRRQVVLEQTNLRPVC